MLNVERIPISKIKPAAYNPRKDLKPGDPEYEKLLKSIDEFDCVEPLVWNRRTGNLIGGHQRLKILAARGDTEVMCSVVDLSPEREKALNLALNKISGSWDDEKLAILLDELIRVPEFDVELTGFDLPEASELIDRLLLKNADEGDDFDVESELQQIVEPKTEPGELIELGPHRILCGDCTDIANIKQLMEDKKAQLVFTDPPYAVGYHGGRVGKDWEHKLHQDGEKHWDQMTVTCYQKLLTKSLHHAYQFSDDKTALYLWFASARIAAVIEALSAAKWEMRNLLVWVKNTFAGSLFAQYKHRYEPCFYCFKKGKSTRWYGPTNETTVWECDKPHRNEGHPTIKPLPLAMRAIRNSSAVGDILLDLFLGSGTTIIAAQRTGRVCFGTELEPRYCDVIRKRYELERAHLVGETNP
ncbi:MAG: site-specific DNA-methyltransferase [Phycisphaerae bacterium]